MKKIITILICLMPFLSVGQSLIIPVSTIEQAREKLKGNSNNYTLTVYGGKFYLVSQTNYFEVNYGDALLLSQRNLTLTGGTGVTITNSGIPLSLDANRAWNISLPQSISTTSTPTFSGLILTNPLSDSYISSSSIWNGKQSALSGTGFVKSTAGVISYDANTYLTTTMATATYMPYSGGTFTSNIILNNVVRVGGSSTFESVFFGQDALNAVTSGTQNVAVGKNSLKAITGGSWNTGVGYKTMEVGTTATKNTAIGSYALQNTTTGQYNTAFGYEAGKANITGNGNVYIGAFTGVGFENRSRRIWISDGYGNVRMMADSLGNVGVGTEAPNSKLHIQDAVIYSSNTRGQLTISDNSSVTKSLTIGLDGTNSFSFINSVNVGLAVMPLSINPQGGNVGIGTTTPNAPLQFGQGITNRKIVLHELANSEHQFYGFGVNGGIFRYQIPTNIDSHVFYAGTSSTTSSELFRINGNGTVQYKPLTTTEINAIASPVQGMTAYNTTISALCFYDGTSWKRLSHSSM